MTAVITARRWNAIDPGYKTGSPTEGTADILRLTTDKEPSLTRRDRGAPAPVRLRPAGRDPGRPPCSVCEGADPARRRIPPPRRRRLGRSERR